MTNSSTPAAAIPAHAAVPPLNLAAGFRELREAILSEIAGICDSGQYVLGPKVDEFERNLAAYCGVPHALGVSSGTDALLIALMALDVGPGDEVIVPTFSFFATAGVVHRVGATPVFVDIEPDSFNLDVSQVEERIGPRTRAIIPVHLYGQLADMHALVPLAQRHGLALVEDAAQAIGARQAGAGARRAGSMGVFGALSFYPTKNLGAIGDAGALLTSDARLFERARKLRIHGSGHTYYHDEVGGNFRIDALQAAILNIKLRRLDAWNEARRGIAQRYDELLAQSGLAPEHVRPPVVRGGVHTYHQYVIRAARRDALAAFLRERGIGCGVYYPVPLHLQKCFAHLGGKAGDCPVAERAAGEVLALPMYPELTRGQQDAVVAAMAAFFSNR